MTEHLTQVNARITEKVKRALKSTLVRLGQTQEEFISDALTAWIYFWSDLDLRQTREFVEIMPYVFQIIKDTENPERKERLREFLGVKEDVT